MHHQYLDSSALVTTVRQNPDGGNGSESRSLWIALGGATNFAIGHTPLTASLSDFTLPKANPTIPSGMVQYSLPDGSGSLESLSWAVGAPSVLVLVSSKTVHMYMSCTNYLQPPSKSYPCPICGLLNRSTASSTKHVPHLTPLTSIELSFQPRDVAMLYSPVSRQFLLAVCGSIGVNMYAFLVRPDAPEGHEAPSPLPFRSWTLHRDRTTMRVAFSPDGSALAVAAMAGHFGVWAINPGSLPPSPESPVSNSESWSVSTHGLWFTQLRVTRITDVSWSPDSAYVSVVAWSSAVWVFRKADSSKTSDAASYSRVAWSKSFPPGPMPGDGPPVFVDWIDSPSALAVSSAPGAHRGISFFCPESGTCPGGIITKGPVKGLSVFKAPTWSGVLALSRAGGLTLAAAFPDSSSLDTLSALTNTCASDNYLWRLDDASETRTSSAPEELIPPLLSCRVTPALPPSQGLVPVPRPLSAAGVALKWYTTTGRSDVDTPVLAPSVRAQLRGEGGWRTLGEVVVHRQTLWVRVGGSWRATALPGEWIAGLHVSPQWIVALLDVGAGVVRMTGLSIEGEVGVNILWSTPVSPPISSRPLTIQMTLLGDNPPVKAVAVWKGPEEVDGSREAAISVWDVSWASASLMFRSRVLSAPSTCSQHRDGPKRNSESTPALRTRLKPIGLVSESKWQERVLSVSLHCESPLSSPSCLSLTLDFPLIQPSSR